MSRSLASPHDQRVTFVELFFDLVFVFSVTQVVALLYHHFSWAGAGQVLLVFWLVWWAWTQFTWALNAADTTHRRVELAVLVATAAAFFLAISVPGAFGARAVWFAVAYVVVRAIGLHVYGWVAESDAAQHAAVRLFAFLSVAGLIAVLVGGILGGAAQYWLWGLAILFDVAAAAAAGQQEGWNLHPEHFSERHGLFVIIALGESLIVAAVGISGNPMTLELGLVATLAVLTGCGLWWSYFDGVKPLLDRALEARTGVALSTLARDAYSIAHFPMLLGVIACAAGIEAAVHHPDEPMALAARVSLGAGLLLFVGGAALPVWRGTGNVPWARVGIMVVLAAATWLLQFTPPLTLGMALAGLVLVGLVESARQSGP